MATGSNNNDAAGGGAGGTSSSHPGTSGRSPAPPRYGNAATGRSSIGGASTTTTSDLNNSTLHNNPAGRLSYGSALQGARLSYGTVATGTTPAQQSTTTASTTNQTVDYLAALSPTTAKFLRGQNANNNNGGEVGNGGAGMGSPTPSKAKANSRLQNMEGAQDMNDDGNNNNNNNMHSSNNINNTIPGQDVETIQLRKFVQSLLGMQLPAHSSSSTLNSNNIPTMATPDPSTAAFYATSLLTKTSSSSSNGTEGGQSNACWRPDDAYLAARALTLKGEYKRAIWILDKVGLIGFGMGAEITTTNYNNSLGEGDAASGVGGVSNVNNNYQQQQQQQMPNISNEEGIRNALLLRAESALLAGQCLIQAGEYEKALTVYEESMRFPPPPPPLEWGMYGYGYRFNTDNGEGIEGEEGMSNKMADEMYIRTWREQSLSHMALIDDGDDDRLLQLASNIRELPFQNNNSNTTGVVEGIHPIARLCAARGMAYDSISNPHRAVPFLRMALTIDSRCMEALDYIVNRRLLTPEEERELISSLNFGSDDSLGNLGISWLRDAYLARLRGSGGVGVVSLPPSALLQEQGDGKETDVSPVPRGDLQSPSMLSLGSPDFAGGATTAGRGQGNQATVGDPFSSKASAVKASPSDSQTIDEAFRNLALTHNLGQSPDVLSHAAIRAYALHDLYSSLAYCTAIDTIDPYCRTAGYVHVATLLGLNLKRRLFQLAHRLVDTDPKDALAWFAVGCYYYACKRYDLAQRHFSRATRLDPSSAECWIGFGCSFAVCDESDQALASFRAAQNKYSGSHVPLLYMGMEYLRTNHLSLAGHFLNSAQKTDPCDMLCCNELGVWSYRQGDMEDAAFWFMKALRLHVRSKGSTLNSTDEGLGMNGYTLLTGRVEQGLQQSRATSANNATTPHAKRRSNSQPPVSTILCDVKTPSGQTIAASIFSDSDVMDEDAGMTDKECIERCNDKSWECTIFNLGQSHRKMKDYAAAIVCFEKCTSMNPGNYAGYAALGFAKHFGGDVDGAIDSYHEALSRKPEDQFTSEMLTRALAEAVTYPPSLAMLSADSVEESRSRGGIGSSLLKKMGNSATDVQGNDHDLSMFTSETNDVDMSSSSM